MSGPPKTTGVWKAKRRAHFLIRVWNRIRNQFGVAVVVAVIVLLALGAISVVAIWVAERHNPNVRSGWSALRWVVLALVSSPPWPVTTPIGKFVGYVVDVLKPGTVAVVVAALTSQMFNTLVARTSGKGRVRLKDHIVICGWSSKGGEILQEIRGRRDEESQRRVVVLAQLPSNPTRDDLTTFIQGDPTEARDLIRAGIEHARTAILLADNSYPGIDAEDMDSRTLITVLAVESLNPACYTCVEVVHSKNRDHFSRTKADELVVSAHMTGALLAHSAVTRGLSRVVGDLLTFPGGNEFYWLRVPPSLAGSTFGSALSVIKEKSDSIVVAIAADGGDYVTNPPVDRVLKEGDRLLLIAEGEPTLP
jgi:voltage-gated potassium channel